MTRSETRLAVGRMNLGATILLILSWAALAWGLFFLQPSTDALDDLEAGPSFAINVAVYLPFLALSLVFALGLVVGALSGPVAAIIGAFCGVIATAFEVAVLSQRDLARYLPGLTAVVTLAALLAAAGTAVFVASAVLRAARLDRGASELAA